MNEKPVKLLHQVPGDDGNSRIYLLLDNERKVPLPLAWRPEEFLLPGNFESHANGKVFGIYDDTTRTAAVYNGLTASPYWQIYQPCLREDFFSRHLPSFVHQAESELSDSPTIG